MRATFCNVTPHGICAVPPGARVRKYEAVDVCVKFRCNIPIEEYRLSA
jgi:hypothetical protein